MGKEFSAEDVKTILKEKRSRRPKNIEIKLNGEWVVLDLPKKTKGISKSVKKKVIEPFLNIASRETEKDTTQAMQALCHNLNTLRSRAADQVPFSSVNFGLDTSEAGRLVSKSLLKQTMKGSGNGDTFIYPISIMHIITGINYLPGDPNYDIYKLAVKCSAKRIYPNFNFADAPFQYKYLRNKKGKLLWKAREDWYIDKGLISKEDLDSLSDQGDIIHSNLMQRIRCVSRIDAKYRKNKDLAFDVASWMNGADSEKLVEQAHKLGTQYPSGVDSLCAGYDDRSTPSRMGCRTYVQGDNLVECDETQEPENYKFVRNERPPYGVTAGRGNFSFITLNLPKFAIESIKHTKGAKLEAKNTKEQSNEIISRFYQYMLKHLVDAKNILQIKQSIIGDKIARNFQFSVGQDAILGSVELKENDKTNILWEHFSKSIGYIGIYEAMTLLYRKDQVDLPEEALEIVLFIRRFTDCLSKGYYVLPTEEGLKNPRWYKDLHKVENSTVSKDNSIPESPWDMCYEVYDINGNKIDLGDNPDLKKGNWSTFATPAESTCMTFRKADFKKYGKIKKVTDKDYYTNSSHVDVARDISIEDKMRIEAPYHALCNAGAIAYIETDGLVMDNPSAFMNILKIMHDNEVGYAAVNHPLDSCDVCHYQGVIPVGEPCPHCGNNDEESITRIRRITGYIVGDCKKWNRGKRAELEDRSKHH